MNISKMAYLCEWLYELSENWWFKYIPSGITLAACLLILIITCISSLRMDRQYKKYLANMEKTNKELLQEIKELSKNASKKD